MEGNITYAELVRLIQEGQISKEELQEAFELDPSRSTAFRPFFRIDTSVVNVEGVELAALSSGHELALSSLAQHERRILGEDRGLAPWAPYALIAEGDSWFQHPLVRTVIDWLQLRGHRIRNLAWPGDTLEEIVKAKEYMPYLSTRAVQFFLLSGGGNDILGNIPGIIRPFDGVHTDPQNAAHVNYYIKAQFTQNLRSVLSLYEIVASDVRSVSTRTLLMVHGYAYARPQQGGRNLGRDFEALGFKLSDPNVKSLTWAIVRELVNRFNLALIAFALAHRNVHYNDFRPVVMQNDDTDWYDEIHPSRKGAGKVADVFVRQLPAPVMAVAKEVSEAGKG